MKSLKDYIKEQDPCWKGYQQIGMKKKNSKEVPNCVPEEVEAQFDLIEDFVEELAVLNNVNSEEIWEDIESDDDQEAPLPRSLLD